MPLTSLTTIETAPPSSAKPGSLMGLPFLSIGIDIPMLLLGLVTATPSGLGSAFPPSS
jgi:hypothetical protein